MREFAGNPCNHYYGAFDEDGTLCGYGGFSQAADEAEILSVAASPARRRQGIGRALLLACLHGMWEEGYGYGIIGSAGPVDFYKKTVGAIVIEDSSPGVYRGMLRG